MSKCKLPKKIMDEFREGADEVEIERPKWTQGGKFLKREGEKRSVKIKRENLSKQCKKELRK